MSVTVEKLEKSMAKLKIEVSAEQLEKAIQKAYEKNKNKIQLPGFRKGKAPRKMIEQMYGKGVFYEDAANELIETEYPKAVEECGENVVSSPKIDVEQLEAGKDFIFTAEVALKPPVKLGKYKGVEVEKMDIDVTDADVDAEIDKQRNTNARTVDVTDRAVQNNISLLLISKDLLTELHSPAEREQIILLQSVQVLSFPDSKSSLSDLRSAKRAM